MKGSSMKKSLYLATLLSSLLYATDYAYEVTPLIGYDIQEGNTDIKNQFLMGAEMQFNNLTDTIKPELSLLYSNGDDTFNAEASTNIYRIALNGVYEYGDGKGLTPFAKAGIGYETMSAHWSENVDSPFVDAGAGIKLPLLDQLTLKLEAVYMLKANDSRWDNNLALLAGLTFSFGANDTTPVTQEEPTVQDKSAEDEAFKKKAQEKEAARIKEQEEAAKKAKIGKEEAAVASAAALVIANADDDKDGVKNTKDLCQTTPEGLEVDENGCALKRDFNLNFEHGSSELDTASKEKVLSFIPFLEKNSFYNVKIIGHTDNTGSATGNQKLSEARAKYIRTLLIDNGIASNRLSAEGKGEAEPIATNDTKEGRHTNRRIEVQLSK